ncbi:MAG: nucleotide triphosphate diphosphatase NUDT15 [Candidatus Gracilibacteria bacterium]
MNNIPHVGVGVCIKKEGKVLLGKRKGSHGEGSWGFPGGALEYGEAWSVCAIRETEEETGISIESVEFSFVSNDIFEKEQKHYVTIFVETEIENGDAAIIEPDECTEWDWFEWNNLPSPMFLPIVNAKNAGWKPKGL